MHGGWGGAMGAGAWGSQPAVPPEEIDEPRGPAPPAGQSQQFGANYSPTPIATPYNGGSSQRVADPPASFAISPAAGGNKEAELRKREADLLVRERRVAEAMKELEKSGVPLKKNNWPICFPFWRHNIGEDIPEKSRRVVREAYLCWYGLIFCLTYQVFCASVMLGYGADQKVPSWFMSIIYWLMGVPLSIWLWYMRIYNAARDDSAVGYIAFFVFFFCHWAWCVFCAIAPQINAAAWSFSGFMAGIAAFDYSNFAGAIYMIGGGLWSVLALYSMWVLKDAWFFFRGQGGINEVQQKQKNEAALTAFTTAQQGNGHNSNRV